MFKLLLKNHNAQKGFTLIELLVVIAIIGMLSSVVLASMNSARTKARDARRLADIKQIQVALELYNDDNQQYPPAVSGSVISGMTATLVTPGYIAALPSDPKYTGSGAYRYYHGASQSSYTILIHLEGLGSNWCKIKTYPGYTGWDIYPNCF